MRSPSMRRGRAELRKLRINLLTLRSADATDTVFFIVRSGLIGGVEGFLGAIHLIRSLDGS